MIRVLLPPKKVCYATSTSFDLCLPKLKFRIYFSFFVFLFLSQSADALTRTSDYIFVKVTIAGQPMVWRNAARWAKFAHPGSDQAIQLHKSGNAKGRTKYTAALGNVTRANFPGFLDFPEDYPPKIYLSDTEYEKLKKVGVPISIIRNAHQSNHHLNSGSRFPLVLTGCAWDG